MIIEGFIWFVDIIDKIEGKHGLTVYEVESVFDRKPIFSKIETHEALVISARDMTDKERKYYAKRKR
jgi:uncharacterized DUF497 family protein